MNIKDLKRGTQIAYIPNHADGDINHSSVEQGFVTSTSEKVAFCRFWSKCYKAELRTKANSEAIIFDNIVIIDSVPQTLVDEMLKKYCAAIKRDY